MGDPLNKNFSVNGLSIQEPIVLALKAEARECF
jgi:hypothetical protein